ncbi:unnamed protein product, partial [Discosporangium mesarthrocarpum]
MDTEKSRPRPIVSPRYSENARLLPPQWETDHAASDCDEGPDRIRSMSELAYRALGSMSLMLRQSTEGSVESSPPSIPWSGGGGTFRRDSSTAGPNRAQQGLAMAVPVSRLPKEVLHGICGYLTWPEEASFRACEVALRSRLGPVQGHPLVIEPAVVWGANRIGDGEGEGIGVQDPGRGGKGRGGRLRRGLETGGNGGQQRYAGDGSADTASASAKRTTYFLSLRYLPETLSTNSSPVPRSNAARTVTSGARTGRGGGGLWAHGRATLCAIVAAGCLAAAAVFGGPGPALTGIAVLLLLGLFVATLRCRSVGGGGTVSGGGENRDHEDVVG